MADGSVSGSGSYVKLTKAQASLQDVKPGELNQPIDVAQVSIVSRQIWPLFGLAIVFPRLRLRTMSKLPMVEVYKFASMFFPLLNFLLLSANLLGLCNVYCVHSWSLMMVSSVDVVPFWFLCIGTTVVFGFWDGVLNARRCVECGQYLPPSYQPPADEDWSTGICGCAEDAESCKIGLFCPCVLFGRNVESINDEIPWNSACLCHAICVEGGIALATVTATFHGIDPDTAFLITEGLLFAWWMCGLYTGMARQTLQRRYHLKDAPCDPCMVHCCLHWCALCQEHREMKGRLEDNSEEKTVVEPPPLQQMNAEEKHQHDKAESSSSGKEIVVASRRSL